MIELDDYTEIKILHFNFFFQYNLHLPINHAIQLTCIFFPSCLKEHLPAWFISTVSQNHCWQKALWDFHHSPSCKCNERGGGIGEWTDCNPDKHQNSVVVLRSYFISVSLCPFRVLCNSQNQIFNWEEKEFGKFKLNWFCYDVP